MTETYVPIREVTDRVIEVLKYFAVASGILQLSIIGALAAWIRLNVIIMILSVGGIIASTIALTIGVYELYIQKTRRR